MEKVQWESFSQKYQDLTYCRAHLLHLLIYPNRPPPSCSVQELIKVRSNLSAKYAHRKQKVDKSYWLRPFQGLKILLPLIIELLKIELLKIELLKIELRQLTISRIFRNWKFLVLARLFRILKIFNTNLCNFLVVNSSKRRFKHAESTTWSRIENFIHFSLQRRKISVL